MAKFKIALNYEFEGNDYLFDVKVDVDDYADYVFDRLIYAKRTKESYAAVVEAIETLDLYEEIEECGFLDWLKEAHEEDAQDQYEYDRDANDVRGLYD